MNPRAQFSHLRLWLYLGANCLPAYLQWLTLNYDTSPRGLQMLFCGMAITICVTTRAYLDGKTTDKVVEETTKTLSAGSKKEATETTMIDASMTPIPPEK